MRPSDADEPSFECTIERVLPPRSLAPSLLRSIEEVFTELVPRHGAAPARYRVEVRSKRESQLVCTLEQWDEQPALNTEAVEFTTDDPDSPITITLKLATHEDGQLLLRTTTRDAREQLLVGCERLTAIVASADAPDPLLGSSYSGDESTPPSVFVSLGHLQELQKKLQRTLDQVTRASAFPDELLDAEVRWGVCGASGRTIFARGLSEGLLLELDSSLERVILQFYARSDTTALDLRLALAATPERSELAISGYGPLSAQLQRALKSTIDGFLDPLKSSNYLIHGESTAASMLGIAVLMATVAGVPLAVMIGIPEIPAWALVSTWLLGPTLLVTAVSLGPRWYPYCSIRSALSRPPIIGLPGFLVAHVLLYSLPLAVYALLHRFAGILA